MLKIVLSSCLLVAAFLLTQTNAQKNKLIVNCYYNASAYVRPGEGQFTSSDIDPSLCSYLSYGFFAIDTNGEVASFDPFFDRPFNSTGNIAKTVALKEVNPSLKVLASIANLNSTSDRFSNMVSSSDSRAKFIQSVLAFLEGNKFDGVDIHWVFPEESDRDNFGTFLLELSAALKPKNLLLTVAVSGDRDLAPKLYDVDSLFNAVDFFNVITYDWAPKDKTGFYSPTTGEKSLEKSIKFWLAYGEKALMGIAFYGHSYKLADSGNRNVRAPVKGPGSPGKFTRDAGILSYNEICRLDWPVSPNNWEMSTFSTNGDEWVGYDDRVALHRKISYLKGYEVAGASVWSIDADDFRGVCPTSKGESFRLLKYFNHYPNLKTT